MEKEPINRKKESRVIQPKGGPGGQAQIADNRANPVQGLIMNGNVAQRVIQREPAAKNKFLFAERFQMDRLPYRQGYIEFARYADKEVLSAGFNGCYMMAFRFNNSPEKKNDVEEMIVPENLSLDYEVVYIAHVASDAREPFFDAVNRELIIVEAIFRPYNGATKPLLPTVRHGPKEINDAKAAFKKFTGGLERDGTDKWEGSVLTQELVPKEWKDEKKKEEENKPRKDYTGTILNVNNAEWYNECKVQSLDSERMKLQTQATLAYIYSRVCLEDLIKNRWSPLDHHPALNKLLEIKDENEGAIKLAWEEILIQGEDCHMAPGRTFDSDVISGFLKAVMAGDAVEYLQRLIEPDVEPDVEPDAFPNLVPEPRCEIV